jgi:hypothetical protein
MNEELKSAEVAKLLGVTRHRVNALARAGQLEALPRVSDFGIPYNVFRRSQVDQLLEDRRQRAAGEAKQARGQRPRPPPG